MKKIISGAFISYFLIFSLFSNSHFSTQAHQTPITDLKAVFSPQNKENAYFSAGEDGFLIKWTSDNQGEHYQITELDIKMISIAPNGKEIAVYESDSGLTNKVSVWNWETLTRKFARKFQDSITSLDYSANGNYIIVGTASIKGAVFINAENGNVVNSKIKEDTGIISYSITTNTEKTCAMYSPKKGTLTYYNLQTGKETKSLYVEPDLEKPVMFNKFMYLAGVKNNSVYVISAVTGKTLNKIEAMNAIILSSKNDENLYYIENDGRSNYSFKVAQNIDGKNLTSPILIKNLKGPRGKEIITHGIKSNSEVMLASRSGDLYKISISPEEETQNLTPDFLITENSFDKILDMCPINENFYFLTKNSLFISSYDTGTVNGVGENPGQTNILPYNDKVILWSVGTKNPVQLFDFSKPELKTLFTPKNNVQTVKLFGNIILEMENNSIVNIYNIDSEKFSEVYNGAGLQDAVIAEDGKLYIAKSFDTNPKSPLLKVDLNTKETVPTRLPGNVSFSLATDKSNIYGINVQESDTSKRTNVFKYNILSDSSTTILSLNDEDSDAFIYLKYPVLYTYIGKSKIRAVNLNGNKSMMLNRSASMPIKIEKNSKRLVVLNRDGSISWYNDNLSQVIADWYITKDGQWYEF